MNRRSVLRMGTLAVAPIAKPGFAARSGVKITDVRTYRMPWNSLFVRILTDEGTWGIGECSPMNCIVEETIIQKALKAGLIGKDPFDTAPLNEQMLYRHFKLGPGGALTCSMAGIDIAPDGSLYLAEQTINRLARLVVTSTYAFHEYTTGVPIGPFGIAVEDSSRVHFTAPASNWNASRTVSSISRSSKSFSVSVRSRIEVIRAGHGR